MGANENLIRIKWLLFYGHRFIETLNAMRIQLHVIICAHMCFIKYLNEFYLFDLHARYCEEPLCIPTDWLIHWIAMPKEIWFRIAETAIQEQTFLKKLGGAALKRKRYRLNPTRPPMVNPLALSCVIDEIADTILCSADTFLYEYFAAFLKNEWPKRFEYCE